MEFIIERYPQNAVGEIPRLIQSVHRQMPQKDWFAADSSEHVLDILRSGRGQALRAADPRNGQTAALMLTDRPGLTEENLGRDIGLPASQLSRVAHMDTAIVLPQYRGAHLQRRMMAYAEQELKKEGFRYLCCTVHPDNRYSLENVLSQGYRIAAVKEKYGGYLRAVLVKELEKDIEG